MKAKWADETLIHGGGGLGVASERGQGKKCLREAGNFANSDFQPILFRTNRDGGAARTAT
jgi:hypothetical protein